MHSGTDVFGIKASVIPKECAGRKLFATMLENHAQVADHGKDLTVLSATARLWDLCNKNAQALPPPENDAAKLPEEKPEEKSAEGGGGSG